jgi:Fe2+ transport system protein FeoA
MTARVLADMERGQTARLEGVDADDRTVHRLAEMGLTPGVEITVLQATKGPVLVAVRGARLAVGRATATAMRIVPQTGGRG